MAQIAEVQKSAAEAAQVKTDARAQPIPQAKTAPAADARAEPRDPNTAKNRLDPRGQYLDAYA